MRASDVSHLPQPYRESLDLTGQVLVRAVRARSTPDDLAELRSMFARLGEPACRAAAKLNQVEALVGQALMSADQPLSQDWQTYVENNRARVRALIAATASVTARIAALGARHAVVESGGTLLGSDLEPSAFCSGDFDMMVDDMHLGAAIEAARAEGFEPVERSGRATTGRLELRRQIDGRVMWLAIGADPFDRTWVPVPFENRASAWLDRTVPSRKNESINVLDPTDALVFVGIHTSTHAFIRAPGLRLHVDVDRIASNNVIDWDRFLREVERARARTRVFTSLAMARALLRTDIPDDVLRHLDPGRARWASILNVLASEGCIAQGRPKLGRGKTLLLDALLDDRGPLKWLHGVVLPPEPWMRAKFDEEGTGSSLWKLHARRMQLLSSRWKPG